MATDYQDKKNGLTYDKNKIWFAIAWIVAYCVLMSVGDMLSELVGVEKAVTLPIALLLSTVLFIFLYINGSKCILVLFTEHIDHALAVLLHII